MTPAGSVGSRAARRAGMSVLNYQGAGPQPLVPAGAHHLGAPGAVAALPGHRARGGRRSTGPSISRAGRTSPPHDEAIGLVDRAIRVPRVILLLGLRSRAAPARALQPLQRLRCATSNRCQYCGAAAAARRAEPRPRRPALARAGRRCGRTSSARATAATALKGGRTPIEAGHAAHARSRSGRSGRRSWWRRSASGATRSGCRS